jgi:sugar O-acyltransferase (sialic acid O-acetyltransferase NeuD family)
VIVLGAGGHAKVVISTLLAAGWRVDAIYDGDPTKHGQQFLGIRVLGSTADVDPYIAANAVIAIGDGERRRAIASQFNFNWVTVIHPTAWVDPSAKIGDGTVVCAGAVVQPGSRIGCHAIINTLAGVDHDCRIGDFAHVGPGAHLAGGVHVGAGTVIGTGASAIPKVHIGGQTVVGAGATVVHDLPDGVVAVGCPAKVLRDLSLDGACGLAISQAT